MNPDAMQQIFGPQQGAVPKSVEDVLNEARGIDKPADGIWGQVVFQAEKVYGALGMMEGDSAPAKRLLFTAIMATGAVYAIRPSSSFDKNGRPRPWAITSPNHPHKTHLPWFLYAVAGGMFGGFFV